MSIKNPTQITSSLYYLGESVAWIGEGRCEDEICLGFASGRLQLFDAHFNPLTKLSNIFGSGEAINGAAFFGETFAVSPTAYLFIGTLANDYIELYSAYGGSHGLAMSKQGTVGAPMGCDGLLFGHFEGEKFFFRMFKSTKQDLHYYQTVFLGKDDQGFECFASACRTDGLNLALVDSNLDFKPGMTMKPTASHNHFGLDAISVCRLDAPDCPFSVGILGIDGTIHLSKDPRENIHVSKRASFIKGTAYSIHSTQEHLVVLTSSPPDSICKSDSNRLS